MIQLYQTLDLRPIGIPQTLRLSQYDSDFEIIFELTNFDGTWILDTGTTAEIQGTKTDGHGYSADAVFDSTELTVTIAGDVQMTAAAGRNVFEVVLFHDGDRLGSKNFVLDVERAALDAETTQSDSQIKNFTAMVEAATQAAETATAAAETAEQAASTFATDTTLKVAGKAADAQAAGQKLLSLSTDIRTSIPTGSDLNDYTAGGNFKITSSSVANNTAHIPNKVSGTLIVMIGSDSSRRYQFYIAQVSSGPRIYVREKLSSSDWTAWTELTYRYTFDATPTEDSGNPVTSGGVFDAIAASIPTYDQTPTEDSTNPVTSGGVFDAIETLADNANGVTPYPQPSSVPQYVIPRDVHMEEFFTYDYIDGSDVSHAITQGICSDGRRYLYFPLRHTPGDSGDSEITYFAKWDALTNQLVHVNTNAPKSYGHCEDCCFVPAYVPGFDNGNVDRLYVTDFNSSDPEGQETGTVYVLSAADMSYITEFTTISLIESDVDPYWLGIKQLGFSPERGMFFAVSSLRDSSNVLHNTIVTFDANGNRVKGLIFTRGSGTTIGMDCDQNFIYFAWYIGSSYPDADGYTKFLHAFDWNLNPISRARMDTLEWEIEGVCHIGDTFYVTWNKAAADRDGAMIAKSTYKKAAFYPIGQTWPVDWGTALRLNSFEYFE